MNYEVTNAFRKWLSYEDFVEYKVGDVISLKRVDGVLKDKYGLVFAETYIKPLETEWIPYDGRSQPVADDVKVAVQYKDYDGFLAELTCLAKDCNWNPNTLITAYKVIEQPKEDSCINDKNVEALRELLKTRAETGFKKYGVTTERKDLTTQQWCQHAIEELLDGAIYLMRLKDDLKAIEALVGDKK